MAGSRRFQAKGKRVYVGDHKKSGGSYVLVKKLPARQQFTGGAQAQHVQPVYQQQPPQHYQPGYRPYKGHPAGQQFQQRSYREAGLYQPPAIRSQPSRPYRRSQAQQQRPESFGWGNSNPKGRGYGGQRGSSNYNQHFLWR
ncbi:unnamed protein product [Ostreobium quekettii]|uniref:Uncharacterized protein n=1 Tax=Ostreobium quekettii TaxID=121088 RepID=A0A8S1ISN8_9CHLO|nr:unnamed protein product [Ostreobium quekettii]